METTTENLPALAPHINGKSLVTLAEEQTNSLPMPVQVAAIVARVKAVKEIVSEVFQVGNHFGEIPGTAKNKDGSAKMVLLKPGFDALCMAFQFAPEFTKQPESVESDKFINIIYKCKLIHGPSGRTIATGDGSCNSKEEKYRWVTAARKCPQCEGEFIRTSKPEDEQGFYCWRKLGGCGATFPKNFPAIENQPEGRKENDNPWNFHNTLTKMAQKRAGMAAIITACGLSSDFTQDMDDLVVEDKPQAAPQPPPLSAQEQEIRTRLRFWRGKLNQRGLTCRTMEDIEKARADFEIKMGKEVWPKQTFHNETETFQSLIDTHQNRVEKDVALAGPAGIQVWIKGVANCGSAVELLSFVKSFREMPRFQTNDCEDALQERARYLGMASYTDVEEQPEDGVESEAEHDQRFGSKG